MPFDCGNTRVKGAHQHDTVFEAKACYGLVTAMSATVPAVVSPFGAVGIVEPPRASAAQVRYIKDLGGDEELARSMSKREASSYIDRLRKTKASMSTRTPDPTPPKQTTDLRLEMVKGLIKMVPVGYYAVQEYDGGHVDFLRLSQPSRGRFSGSIKVQTIHGSGFGAKLELAVVLWSSDRFSVYKDTTIDPLLLLCADYEGAALRYAEKIGRCCRCNAELTDGRSRWYGIGPECEKHIPWMIDNVTERKGPFRGER